MELENLAGRHMFQGIDLGVYTYDSTYGDEANCIKFKLDGIVYICKEDPDDGYRSYMRELETSDERLNNEFEGVQVDAVYVTGEIESVYVWDVLKLIDCKTKKDVLIVGTIGVDGYYPRYVGEYHPENMVINTKGE